MEGHRRVRQRHRRAPLRHVIRREAPRLDSRRVPRTNAPRRANRLPGYAAMSRRDAMRTDNRYPTFVEASRLLCRRPSQNVEVATKIDKGRAGNNIPVRPSGRDWVWPRRGPRFIARGSLPLEHDRYRNLPSLFVGPEGGRGLLLQVGKLLSTWSQVSAVQLPSPQ